MRAMVMAAGVGTRLDPLTRSVPKPMVPVLNQPVISYTLENLKAHGVTECALNLHSFPDQVKTFFSDGHSNGMVLRYSKEKVLLGTAGGVKKMEPFLRDEPFFVMSGDGLCQINLTKLKEFHIKNHADVTMVVVPSDSQLDYGLTYLNNNRITSFLEKPRWSDYFPNTVNTGIYVINPDIFKLIPKGVMYDFGKQLWPKLLNLKKNLMAFHWDEFWCDIGNPQEYRRAQWYALEHVKSFRPDAIELKPGIWAEERIRLPKSLKLKPPCFISKNVQLDENVVLGPYVVLGDRTRVCRGAKLERSIVWSSAVIGANTVIENAIILNDVHVAAKTRLNSGNLI